MTIFGDKANFAIEVESCGREDIFFFCFWCHGKQIGDYDNPVNLSHCINSIHEFLLYSKNRSLKGSRFMHKERLFFELYDGMYVPLDRESRPEVISYELLSSMDFAVKRDIFHMDGIGQYSFLDKIGIILVDEEEKNRQRLIWREFLADTSLLYEEFFPSGYVDNVLIELLDAFGRPIKTINDWILQNTRRILLLFPDLDLKFDKDLFERIMSCPKTSNK